MSEKKGLVILIACGLEDERMSVAWSVANGGISTGLQVTVFLTSSAVDCVRKGAANKVHLNPVLFHIPVDAQASKKNAPGPGSFRLSAVGCIPPAS